MPARGDGSSHVVHTDERIFPACNVHSFIFSNPFTPTSQLVKSMHAAGDKSNAMFPPIPPHKPIFYDPDTAAAITHARLRRDTLRLAHGVHQRFGTPRVTDVFGKGTSAGPVVLVHLPNCIAWPVIIIGFLGAGWTATGTNPGYTPGELAHVIEQCEPSVVICHPGSGGEDVVRAACRAANHGRAEILLVDPMEDLYGADTRPRLKGSWVSLLSNRELEVAPMSVREANERVGFILWTSGTTGKMKGAMLSHRSLIAGIVQHWGGHPLYCPDERWLGVPPFYHTFGLYNQVLLAPCIGATVVMISKFNLEAFLRLASAHRATHLHIAPPIAVSLAKSDLLNQPWCSLDSVVAAFAGGAPLAPDIIEQVWKRLKVIVKLGYGSTETGGATASKGHNWDEIEPQLGACGKPHLGVQLSIVDEDGKLVPPGTPGEIIIRSPSQMIGYIKNPQATAENLDEKGIHTGDVGYIDRNGNIRIVERIKELIKYKAFQVSPTELEAIIAALPEVQDVAVASVYSHAQGTELPLAYVVPRSSALPRDLRAQQALADKVKLAIEKNCIHYKRLRGGVTFIPAIPKSPSGKTLRRLLKDQKGIHVDCYAGTGQSKL